jgi:hypothetical protein
MNLPDEVLHTLRELADRYDITMTEAVRRAISVLKYLDDERHAGRDVLIRDPQTKETDRLIFH